MMAPSARLLAWVAVLGLPVGALGAFVPAALPVSLALVAGLLLLAAIDALLGADALGDVEVEAPAVVHLSAGRPGEVALVLRSGRSSRGPRRLRAGLAVPRELALAAEVRTATLPAAEGGARIVWTCHSSRRGVYPVGPLVVATGSPLGLFEVRRRLPLLTELRVYPTLLRERRAIAALFLNRGPFGAHALRQVGKGREFEKLREYVPGDPTEDIHWKATARRGRPITKLFQIERTQEVYVLVDASRLSGREAVEEDAPPAPETADAGPARPARDPEPSPLPAPTVLDRFVTAALALALAAERQGDRFGLIAFSDRIDSFARAQAGRAQHRATREALLRLEPRLVAPDFEELFTFVRLRLRRRALLLVLTSLDDPALAQSFSRAVEIVSRQHLVLVNAVRPMGVRPLFEEPDARTTEDVYRRLGGHVVWSELRELTARLRRIGVTSALLDGGGMIAPLLEQYMRVKRRQLL